MYIHSVHSWIDEYISETRRGHVQASCCLIFSPPSEPSTSTVSPSATQEVSLTRSSASHADSKCKDDTRLPKAGVWVRRVVLLNVRREVGGLSSASLPEDSVTTRRAIRVGEIPCSICKLKDGDHRRINDSQPGGLRMPGCTLEP